MEGAQEALLPVRKVQIASQRTAYMLDGQTMTNRLWETQIYVAYLEKVPISRFTCPHSDLQTPWLVIYIGIFYFFVKLLFQ